MAQRYWVKREADDKTAVETYFDNEGKAKAVAEALERESEGEYYVSSAP
ncbi:hypothetical protein HLRTI_002892 [Halorhabdus tiamatea SARL4B]|uniref:Uncharacterized protein n=1 Tax=Halorhabdus tiamatea SARL4B TaxID=1033806 RepID=U2DY42_9EURY|nr:hypothetical protein [Halorhabdus tiamatea]ERJ05093.1 hypothetical protein HLRTI_002892 [Halorhabdus tiamatea SARL4B]